MTKSRSEAKCMADVIQFPSRRFVKFYSEPIECDFCNELTQCRVYEESQEIVCCKCNTPMFEFQSTEPQIIFTPEAE